MAVHDTDEVGGRVDCDIHVGYEALSDLYPYLRAQTRDLLQNSATFGFTMPGYTWQHPTGWIRRDTYSETATGEALTPGFTLEQLRSQLLDRYSVDVGIAIPDEAAGYSVLPNTGLATELCSAYNDWLADHWLAIEPRLRGTIVVPAQNPAAAAAEIRRLAGRDQFVGVFLPGAARIPYGNPIYDPIWQAADETGLPVVVHVHYEGIGIAGPLTGAGHPDFYMEYHALFGLQPAGASSPRCCATASSSVTRTSGCCSWRAVLPLSGAPLAPRHQLEGLSQRNPSLRQTPIAVCMGSRPLQHSAARNAGRASDAPSRSRAASTLGDGLLRAAITPTGTSTSPTSRSTACPPIGARRFSVPMPPRFTTSTSERPQPHDDQSASSRAT